ncbi:hypothetical protein RhiJN_20872 [Ceratobasidium sp. AG-Ba]|nr:hypothetical protein RhiJN_20872 [Ceratobasidium sp. AG-Ba]
MLRITARTFPPASSCSLVSSSASTPAENLSGPVQSQALAASVDGGIKINYVFVLGYPATMGMPSSAEAAAASNVNPNNFLLNSGAQVHLCSLYECFRTIGSFKQPLNIHAIGEKVVTASQHGVIFIPLRTRGDVFWLRILNVVYALDPGRNFISLGRLWRMHGVKPNFNSNSLASRSGDSYACRFYRQPLASSRRPLPPRKRSSVDHTCSSSNNSGSLAQAP